VTDVTERMCPSCGHANPAGSQFCGQCGAILVKGRDVARRAVEPPPPEPLESGRSFGELESRSVEPQRPANRAMWLAGGATALVLALALAFVTYQRFHANGMIPIPGDTTPTAIPPREAPAPVVQPTASGSIREAPERAEAPVATPRRASEPPPAQEPPELMPTMGPRVASREAPRPAPPERAEEARSQRQPGWYRVRYRSPLFREPDETSPVITQLKAGTRVRVTRVLSGFLRVESTTGKEPGYLSSDDALPESVAGPVR
jgi:hypothetical protein